MANLEPSEIKSLIDQAVRERFAHIDDLLAELQHQLILRWAFALTGLVIAAVAIYFVAHKASNTANLVQLERHQTVVQNCQSQNARNVKTLGTLDTKYGQFEVKATPAEKAQLQASKSFTISLINDLVPMQNCQAVGSQQAPLHATP